MLGDRPCWVKPSQMEALNLIFLEALELTRHRPLAVLANDIVQVRSRWC